MVSHTKLAEIGLLLLTGAGCADRGPTAGPATVGPSPSATQAPPDRHHHRSGRPALRPPAPRVSTIGITRIATLVSYCWNESGNGVCADGAPGHASHVLRWRADAPVRVDLRLAADDVSFQTARIVPPGAERDFGYVRVRPLDRNGRSWIFCLPPHARRANDLLISARFADGDMLADLRLEPEHRPRPHTHSPLGQRCP